MNAQYDDFEDNFDGGSGCYACGGSGWFVDCIDDMCHGQGECIHGDPPRACPNCNADMRKDPC